jgi:Flp pilus assembly protein CpaB
MAWALVLAATTGSATAHLVAIAESGAARYGDPTTVLVARRDLPVGAELDGLAVALTELPASAVPVHALRRTPGARVLRQPVAAGQVVVELDLAGPGTSPLAAAIPPGTTVFAVPRGGASLRVRRGDHVDLLGAGSGGDGLVTVTADALVLDIRADSFSVAVDRNDATDVAAAILAGAVVPALRGTTGGGTTAGS